MDIVDSSPVKNAKKNEWQDRASTTQLTTNENKNGIIGRQSNFQIGWSKDLAKPRTMT